MFFKIFTAFTIILLCFSVSRCQENSLPFYFYKNYFLNLENLEKIKIKDSTQVFDENKNSIFIYGKGYRGIDIFSRENGEKVSSFTVEGKCRPIINDFYLISGDEENFYIYDLKGNKVFTVPCRIKTGDEENNYFYSQIALYKDNLFLTTPNNGLKIVSMKTKEEKILENEEKNIKQDINGRNFLFAINNGVIYIKDLDCKKGIFVYKYDENGNVLFKTPVEHTDIEVKGDINYCHRYLNYFTHTDNNLIFTTNVFEKPYNTTRIVDLKTGKVTEAELIVSGILTDDGGNLTGLMSLDDEKNVLTLYDSSGGVKKWDYEFPSDIYSESTSPLLYGNILVVSYYCRISTGSELMALNAETGELLWDAEVVQLMVPHSKYYNSVFLSRYGEKLVMRGCESGGTYVQVFDVNTGKRLFEDTELL